jgi:hypothetical protein
MHSVNVKLSDDVSPLVNTYVLKFNITRTSKSLDVVAPTFDIHITNDCGLCKSVQIDKVICSTEKEIYIRICEDIIIPGLYVDDF